jgi:hypothetical protein
LFSPSPPYANLAAVDRNLDKETLRVVQKSAGLPDPSRRHMPRAAE